MIVVELAFGDDPRRLAARAAHRERLGELRQRGVLVLAGPLADDSGALLVFDAERAVVERELADDPYYALTRVVSVREWSPVVA
jgi:uncharacterized protein YciI